MRDDADEVGFTIKHGDEQLVCGEAVLLKNARGDMLAQVPDFIVPAGARCLVRGRSGSGKSTLLRALAGLWPYGEGTITTPSSGMFFVPQRSYIPSGTLKAAITYPRDESAYDDAQCEAVLHACGLSAYIDSLHVADRWGGRFSGGEQQRVAFARALLMKPNVLFLDECTSALDSQSEKELYSLLLASMPNTTILSVAHRKELAALHDMSIDFGVSELVNRGELQANEETRCRPLEGSEGLAKMAF